LAGFFVFAHLQKHPKEIISPVSDSVSGENDTKKITH
jgi:hypothetical protein